MKKFEVIWVGENSQGMIYSGKEIVEAKNKIEAERKIRLSSKNGITRFVTGVNEILKYEIVLKEKEFTDGLTRPEIIDMLDMLDGTEVYPIELEARDHECAAMGFISPNAASKLWYNYELSGLHDFIANILDDMKNESDDCTYEFKGIKIWLSR